jgi:hypothetical protein
MGDELGDALNLKHETLAEGQLESFFQGGLEGTRESAPTPARSKGSTGRTFASTKFSTGRPRIADPGVRNAYPEPDELDVENAVDSWKAFKDGYIAVGTSYYVHIDVKYPIIPTATLNARERLEKDHGATVRRAENA